MSVVGWIAWGSGCLVLLAQLPLAFHPDGGVARLAKRFAVLVAIGLAVTEFIDVSKLHLLWWVPLAYVLNLIALAWTTQRNMTKLATGIREVGLAQGSITPEIGRDIAWNDVIRQVFRVWEFDRADTTVGPNDTVKAVSRFAPYGYLFVESPILNQPSRLPITHRVDFLLAASVFDDPDLADAVEREELLVTYAPKHILPKGLAGIMHTLHYVITPRGTLDRYYTPSGPE